MAARPRRESSARYPLAGVGVGLASVLLALVAGSASGQASGGGAEGWEGPRADLLPREECLNCRNWSFSGSLSDTPTASIEELSTKCKGRPEHLPSDEDWEFCEIAPLFSDGGYDLFSVWSVQQQVNPGGRYPSDYSTSKLIAREHGTGETATIFEVGVGRPIGSTGVAVAVVDTPLGTLVRVPLIFDGTGYLNEDFIFWWDGQRLIEIDETDWRGDFGMPAGMTVRKGFVLDLETQSVGFDIWPERGSERPQYPYGARVEVTFGGREGRQLVVGDFRITPHPGP